MMKKFKNGDLVRFVYAGELGLGTIGSPTVSLGGLDYHAVNRESLGSCYVLSTNLWLAKHYDSKVMRAIRGEK